MRSDLSIGDAIKIHESEILSKQEDDNDYDMSYQSSITIEVNQPVQISLDNDSEKLLTTDERGSVLNNISITNDCNDTGSLKLQVQRCYSYAYKIYCDLYAKLEGEYERIIKQIHENYEKEN